MSQNIIKQIEEKLSQISMGNCCVCGSEIPPYIKSSLGTRDKKHPVDSKEWYHVKQYVLEPAYFIGDNYFCSCKCAVKWYEKDRKIQN